MALTNSGTPGSEEEPFPLRKVEVPAKPLIDSFHYFSTINYQNRVFCVNYHYTQRQKKQ